MFLKILRVIYKKIKFMRNKKFDNYLEKKIHNTKNISKFLLPKNVDEFDIIFSQNGITSGWSNEFYFNKKNSIIINHSATSSLPGKNAKILSKARPRGDYMFVNNEIEKRLWKKKYDQKRIIVVGMPKLNFYTKPIKHLNSKKTIIFAYSSSFKKYGHRNDLILQKQLEQTLEVLSIIKNIKVILKIHPVRNHPYYLKILEKYDRKIFSTSNENLNSLAYKSDLLITTLESSSVLDGLLSRIPTIELWRTLKELSAKPYSFFSINYLSKLCKNNKELSKYVQLALKFPNNKLWKKQQIQFKKIYSYKKINYDYLLSKLLIKSKINKISKI